MIYLERMLREAVVAYVKELSQNLSGGTEEYHEKFKFRIAGLQTEIRTRNLRNMKHER
jgi:hypothetical protein